MCIRDRPWAVLGSTTGVRRVRFLRLSAIEGAARRRRRLIRAFFACRPSRLPLVVATGFSTPPPPKGAECLERELPGW
eukprot:8962142-Alexandrium_andersonii.AAC.1